MTEPPLQTARVSPWPRGTWFSLVAAPIAWAVQGLAGWFVSGAGCREDASFWGVPLSTLTVIAAAVSILALAVAMTGVVIGVRNWRGSDERVDLNAIEGRSRSAYLAAAGVLISGVFVVNIIWAGLGAVLVNPCGQMR